VVRELAERVYFWSCLTLGRLLRAGTYSRVHVFVNDGTREVRKRRAVYAPLLVALGGSLVRILNTGMRVLPRRDWVEREGLLYQSLYDASIRLDSDGALVLPFLAGETLASLLDEAPLGDAARTNAIGLAVRALAELHARGLTHADAMAENVLVDVEGGVARWFDFETVHDASRSMIWRRADDLRALISTCLTRTDPAQVAETLQVILATYLDDRVTRALAEAFASVFQRSLTFHLAQAPLSFERFREIARLLSERSRP
jgi:tRNA A-37 threonylcarbamoyl transferase component Bud32